MEYLVWLFLASVIPLLLLWLRYWKLLWKYRATIIFVTVLMFIIHVPWDIAAVSSGLWYFPEGKNLGFFIVNLPLEDTLGKSVDLVGFDSIKPRLKQYILPEQQSIL